MPKPIQATDCRLSNSYPYGNPKEATVTPYRDRLDKGQYQGKQTTTTVVVPPEPIPDEADDGNGASLQCPECDRTFKTQHALKIHTAKAHEAF